MSPSDLHDPVVHDLVLVGGGHSHVEVIRKLAMRPEPGLRITLVTRDVQTPYSGMLPGLLAEHYSVEEAHIDLLRLCRLCGVRLIHGSVNAIDFQSRRISIPGRPDLSFDTVSVDIGSAPDVSRIRGHELALKVKPVDVFRRQWADAEADLISKKEGEVVVIGAGAGGVELILSLQHRLRAKSPDSYVVFKLIGRGADLLPSHAPAVRKKFLEVLQERNVIVHMASAVSEVEKDAVVLESGERVSATHVVLVTSAAPASWLRDLDVDKDDRGFISINDNLQSVSEESLFAAGDCATMRNHSLPKAGVYAVRQGPVLAENLRARVNSGSLVDYVPQRNILALISTGDRYAIASRGAFTVSGRWVWSWKDRIDRKWMDKYRNIPSMNADSNEPDTMRCGGCGAKVPASVLREVIGGLDIPEAPGLVLGVGAPDDAAAIEVPAGKILVQSVDQFRAFTDDAYLFSRIATNHCLGDLYAMGATPHSALAAVTLPFAGSHIIASELDSVLRGTLEVLGDAGATLIGGHTAEGAELTFGLTVNGFGERDRLVTKSRAAIGDVVIVTKGIGTGVVLAADMRGEASHSDLVTTFESMLLSNQKAAQICIDLGAGALTDVTGFGLLGHLDEIACASHVEVELDLRAVPLLAGAAELTNSGFASTLAPGNALDATRVERRISGESDRWQLLFDPQTAGGLLATIPEANAPSAVERLRQNGYDATAIIGRVVESSANEGRVIVV